MSDKTIQDLVGDLVDAADALEARFEEIEAEVGSDAFNVEEDELPTLEEISLNVSGTDDLHERNPGLFEKMRKYYNPEKVPFTASTWMRTGWGGKDARGWKPVLVDGVEYRRMKSNVNAPDWYWIIRGVRDVTADGLWLQENEDFANPSHETAIRRLQNYNGGLRFPPKGWPEEYFEALPDDLK